MNPGDMVFFVRNVPGCPMKYQYVKLMHNPHDHWYYDHAVTTYAESTHGPLVQRVIANGWYRYLVLHGGNLTWFDFNDISLSILIKEGYGL